MAKEKLSLQRNILTMPLDKKALKDRIEQMFWLEKDWDGCGSLPISKKVYDISKQMIDLIDVNTEVKIKIFVGVVVEGSLYLEANRGDNKIELTVNPDGIIDYNEINNDNIVSSGTFVLSPETINSILA